MKDMFRFGILAAGLLFCLGCSGDKTPATEETEAKTKELYESPEYEQQMMGTTPKKEEAPK